MATPTKAVWDTLLADSHFRNAFLNAPVYHSFVSDWMRERLPTEASIKADVAKLRSVSAAGCVWIADRRMAIASVGPWRDTFILRKIGEGYPAIITRARREGLTYTTRLAASNI